MYELLTEFVNSWILLHTPVPSVSGKIGIINKLRKWGGNTTVRRIAETVYKKMRLETDFFLQVITIPCYPVPYPRKRSSASWRKVIHGTAGLGRPKVDSAKARIEDVNPHVKVETFYEQLNSENALRILEGYDVVSARDHSVT